MTELFDPTSRQRRIERFPLQKKQFNVSAIQGHSILTHDGGIDGFLTNVSLLPEQSMGVVVMMGTARFPAQGITERLWQHILNLPLTDTVKTWTDRIDAMSVQNQQNFPDPAVITISNLADYVGKFCNPVYGAVSISAPTQDQLHISMRVINADIQPSAADQFFVPGE